MTYLSHQLGSQIPDIIMTDRREGSSGTAKGMFYIVGFATNTIGREVRRRPSIAERNCITKIPLVKGEPMTIFLRGDQKKKGIHFTFPQHRVETKASNTTIQPAVYAS